MEATKAAPPKSSAAVNDSSGTNNAASAEEATTATNNNNDTSSSNKSESEDFLMFGARPSHLFDDIAITIDSLLTEEIASLPLLPRTLTDEELRQASSSSSSGDKPLTGEQKLIAKLRKAYKKNLDLAETYCSRNVFTVQYYSKTKRRKILENFLHSEENNNGEDEEGKKLHSSSE